MGKLEKYVDTVSLRAIHSEYGENAVSYRSANSRYFFEPPQECL